MHGVVMQNIPPEFEIQVGVLLREAMSLAQSLALAMVKDAFETGVASMGTPARPTVPSRTSKRRARKEKPRLRQKSRSSAEIATLGEKFVAEVRAHPGESMTTLSAHVGVSSGALVAVVSRLKREEKVRVIGSRGSARYFPATETADTGSRAA